jgi:hypothetical protein
LIFFILHTTGVQAVSAWWFLLILRMVGRTLFGGKKKGGARAEGTTKKEGAKEAKKDN